MSRVNPFFAYVCGSPGFWFAPVLQINLRVLPAGIAVDLCRLQGCRDSLFIPIWAEAFNFLLLFLAPSSSSSLSISLSLPTSNDEEGFSPALEVHAWRFGRMRGMWGIDKDFRYDR